MSIERLTADLAIISKLGNNPGQDNGLTTDEFKSSFDEAALTIQDYINEVLLPEVEAGSNPQEGLNMRGAINMNNYRISGLPSPYNDTDAATWKAAKDYADSLHFTTKVLIPVAGWTSTAPYTATIQNVEGILASDTPHYSVVYSSDAETRLQEKEAFAMIDDLETGKNKLTFTCFEEKPEVLLNIQLEVNR